MSWLVSIMAAVLGMICGGAGMFAIAMGCVKWYRISSFEGQSGYFIIGLTLIGIIVGGIIALVSARVSCAMLGPQWYYQLAGSAAAVGFALVTTLLLTYQGLDHTPTIDGKNIITVWEVRLPAGGTNQISSAEDPRNWPDEELRLELVSVSNHQPRGSCLAEFDRSSFRQEDGQWILTARAPLFSSKGEYCVNLTLGGRDDGFWPAMRPSSAPGYLNWSNWVRTNKGNAKPDDRSATMYRFRFEAATDSGDTTSSTE